MSNFQHHQPGPRRSKIGLLWLCMFSAILGGLFVLVSIPYLADHGLVRIELARSDEGGETVTALAPSLGDAGEAERERVMDPNERIVYAVNQVRPAVVGVINLKEEQSWFSSDKETETGLGTGVIFEEANGMAKIVTNYHVIEGAKEVVISLPSGDRKQAKILGADAITDLAVLEIDAGGIDGVAQFGDSSILQPGETAIAIGNPLGLEFSQTVTVGVISSADRAIPIDYNKDGQMDWELDVIQTDAAINPGNSGGALVNRAGEVIGINSLKIAEKGVEGLGFAIPINDAKPIIEQLIEYGKVRRPYMGVTPRDLSTVSDTDRTDVLKLPDHVDEGILLAAVRGPALKAGLQQWDVIVRLDGKRIERSPQLRKYLYREKEIGDSMRVDFYRGGELRSVTLVLTEMDMNVVQ